MKTRLIALVMVLSIFVLGISSSSFAQEKGIKKTHDKTMMMDSTKVKTHKMESDTMMNSNNMKMDSTTHKMGKKEMMWDSTKSKTNKNWEKEIK
jgi:hypothetical protein